jgi:N-acetyl sugar amidotransferase
MLRYRYKMHPLLVMWPPIISTPMGRRNFDSWVKAGFDCITYTPNQKTHRLLTKLAFEKLVHPFQPFIIGQKNTPVKISMNFRVPLVFYGESDAEYGNAIKFNQVPTRPPEYYASDERLDEVYLGGVSAKQLIDEYGLTRSDLEPYLPADPNRLKEVGTEVHYMGYYHKWDQQEAYYFAVENTDFLPNDERTEGGYSKYASIDDKIDWFHFYTYHVKFGLGRASHDASQEIRSGHITRDEGIRLVRRFDGEFPLKYLKDNIEYMGINEEKFHDVIERARPPHLWEKINGSWKLKHFVQ